MENSKHRAAKKQQFLIDDSSDSDQSVHEGEALLNGDDKTIDDWNFGGDDQAGIPFFYNSMRVKLERSPVGFGLRITNAIGNEAPANDTGVYVCNIAPNSPAHRNGQIQVGDQILAINDINLATASFHFALTTIRNSPDVSTFTVRKMLAWE